MSEDNDISRDLKPSQELLDILAEVRERYGRAKELVAQAYQLAIRDGFSPQQARQFLTAQLPFLAERTIRLALPQEAKDQSKDHSDAPRHTLPRNPEPKQPNIVNITTKAEIKDAELVNESEPVSAKELEYMNKIPEQEDPKDLEIQFLKDKVTELEDALKKTQQFKPATELEPTQDEMIMEEEEFEKWLKRRADGGHSFYYDAYGIDLFKNRELSQLKNSGVKVFRRLYFEV